MHLSSSVVIAMLGDPQSLTTSSRRAQIEEIQSKKLVASAQSFLRRHQLMTVRTASVDRQIRDFLCTFEHIISTRPSTDPTVAEAVALKASMSRLLAVRCCAERPDEHHLSTLREVTVQKIERVKEVQPQAKPVNDSVSAVRIQALLQDQKVLFLALQHVKCSVRVCLLFRTCTRRSSKMNKKRKPC